MITLPRTNLSILVSRLSKTAKPRFLQLAQFPQPNPRPTSFASICLSGFGWRAAQVIAASFARETRSKLPFGSVFRGDELRDDGVFQFDGNNEWIKTDRLDGGLQPTGFRHKPLLWIIQITH